MKAHQQMHSKKKKNQNTILQNRFNSRVFSLTLCCAWKSTRFCTCSLSMDFGSVYVNVQLPVQRIQGLHAN